MRKPILALNMKENVYVGNVFVIWNVYIKINHIIANKNVKNYLDMKDLIFVKKKFIYDLINVFMKQKQEKLMVDV